MTQFYILLESGQPFGHPITASNFRLAYPNVDLENLPEWVAAFQRTPRRDEGPYEEYVDSYYMVVDGVVVEVHNYRQFSAEERRAKQNETHAMWAMEGFPSWVFDENNCAYVPPTPKPDDGNVYLWDEPTQTWRIASPNAIGVTRV